MVTKKGNKLEFEISISKDGIKTIKSGNKIRKMKKNKEGIYMILKGDAK